MEDPEAYLRAMAARLAPAREGSPLPVTRFSVEAVANAFVMLGLLPAARAEEILAAQRPVLEAAGFRLGLEIGELGVNSDARAFREARATGANSSRWTPLAVAAGPVRCRLPGHDLTITSATLTPEGIWLRYHGDAQEGDRREAGNIAAEIADEITELSITDDTGATYLMPPGTVNGAALRGPDGARRQAGCSGCPKESSSPCPSPVRPLPAVSGGPSGGSSSPPDPARAPLPSAWRSGRPPWCPRAPRSLPWPTPAEAYLAELAPVYDWSIGSFETGPVELDAPEIVAAVAGALLAVGALPPGSALLTAAQYRERRPVRPTGKWP